MRNLGPISPDFVYNMYEMISDIIITMTPSRGRGSRPDHYYQFTVYHDIGDPHTAAEIDSVNLGS